MIDILSDIDICMMSIERYCHELFNCLLILLASLICYDIVALSLVMTACWDGPRWYGTLYVYGYGRVSIYMVVGIFPLGLVPSL